MVSLDALWNELKATYQKDLSPASYNTWIETANPRTLDQNQLVVEVPSKIHKEYWEKNLATKIVEVGYMQKIQVLFITRSSFMEAWDLVRLT